MKNNTLSKILTLSLAALMTLSLTGCRMQLPDVSGIGPKEDSKKEEAEAPEEEVYTDEDLQELLFDDTNGNTDVTAGTVEEGYYNASAILNDETYVYVDASEAVLKEKSPSKPVKIKDNAGNLQDARLAYLTNYYEGDETSAKEDLAEYEKADITAEQRQAIKAFDEDLGKIFAQFDIATYDFTSPQEADETYVTYDTYSSANEPFILEFTFNEDNTIAEISFSYDGEL